jgi:hypothetical protein
MSKTCRAYGFCFVGGNSGPSYRFPPSPSFFSFLSSFLSSLEAQEEKLETVKALTWHPAMIATPVFE